MSLQARLASGEVPGEVAGISAAALARLLAFGALGLLVFGGLLAVIYSSLGPVNLDASFYLVQALNLEKGLEYVHASGAAVVHRPPLFPTVLAAAFRIFGTSVGTAHAVTEALAFLNVLLVYALGRRIYGSATGLAAGALALGASGLLDFYTEIQIDTMFSFLMLSTVYLLVAAVKRGSGILFFLAGATTGLAVLTKETALVVLPAPAVLMLIVARRPHVSWVPQLLLFYSTTVLTAGWWWWRVYDLTSRVYLWGEPRQRFTPLLAWGSS